MAMMEFFQYVIDKGRNMTHITKQYKGYARAATYVLSI